VRESSVRVHFAFRTPNAEREKTWPGGRPGQVCVCAAAYCLMTQTLISG
jgi:hypothetical protein